ncbi:MAG: hypothetical protein GU354_03225 [Caldimicrobium sp.]|jgi:hypothetical protein|nr:hypothetical protein [Caldimicrobium sp.]
MIRNLIKQEVLRYYKKEFYLWLGAVLLLGLSLSLSIKEYKKLTINLQSQATVEESYYKLSKEIVRLKEVLKRINLKATQTMISIPFNGTYDLRDLNKAIFNVKNLTQSNASFLVIRELKLIKENDIPKLKLTGEIVVFQSEGS